MATISLQCIAKSFGPVRVIDHVSLDISDGEFVVLVGPSGCGKSTILRMLAGLEKPSAGRILIGDRDVTDLPPGARDVAMVFQNYALYPHMTVAENMSFSLRLNHVPKPEIGRRVMEAARILRIETLLARKPKELSGGQRQRVAMGRAIVRAPLAFLFDEPLSNLDAQLRGHMRAEIALLQKRLRGTVVYVTHDQIEAMTLADRIVIFNAGRIQQVGTPEEVFERPANLFVAKFIGSPTMNLLPTRISPDGDRLELANANITLPRPANLKPQTELLVGIRPQSLRREFDPKIGFAMDVELVEYLGTETMVTGLVTGTADTQITAIIPGAHTKREPRRLRLSVEPHAYHLFDAQTGLRLPSYQDATTGGLHEAS